MLLAAQRAACRAARAQQRRAASHTSAAVAASPPEVELPVLDLGALDWRRAGGGVAAAAERAAALRALRSACADAPGCFALRTEALIPPPLVERVYAHARAFHDLPDALKAPYHHTRDRNGRCAALARHIRVMFCSKGFRLTSRQPCARPLFVGCPCARAAAGCRCTRSRRTRRARW
jgi:hypothetical protein